MEYSCNGTMVDLLGGYSQPGRIRIFKLRVAMGASYFRQQEFEFNLSNKITAAALQYGMT